MDATQTLSLATNLRLHSPEFGNLSLGPSMPATPNQWFAQQYPNEFERFGSPFLELTQSVDQFSTQTICVSINHDFSAGVLGGRKDLGHHVIYYSSEMAWYFRDSDGIYKTTTDQKLMTLFRALILKAAEKMPANVHKLNLCHEFRSEKTAKTVILRAKSILEADQSFFSPDSPHQRIKGPELVERVARVFVDSLLTAEPGHILKLQDAYSVFRELLKQRAHSDIQRSDFKAVVAPLIREQFNVALRNDLKVDDKAGQRGWKNLKLLQSVPA